MTEHTNIHDAMVAISAEVSKVGIGKDRTNATPGQNYKFRGIDDTINVLSPLFARHGVVLLPSYHDIKDERYTTKNGASMQLVTLRGTFTFSHASGSLSVSTYGAGAAMDDKAALKAMSAALKYALGQTLMIPFIGHDDGDSETPDGPADKPAHDSRISPRGPDASNRAPAPQPGEEKDRTKAKDLFSVICGELGECTDDGQIAGLVEGYKAKLEWIDRVRPDLMDGGGDIPSWTRRVNMARYRAQQAAANK